MPLTKTFTHNGTYVKVVRPFMSYLHPMDESDVMMILDHFQPLFDHNKITVIEVNFMRSPLLSANLDAAYTVWYPNERAAWVNIPPWPRRLNKNDRGKHIIGKTLTHEYTHTIWRTMPERDKERWTAMYQDVGACSVPLDGMIVADRCEESFCNANGWWLMKRRLFPEMVLPEGADVIYNSGVTERFFEYLNLGCGCCMPGVSCRVRGG